MLSGARASGGACSEDEHELLLSRGRQETYRTPPGRGCLGRNSAPALEKEVGPQEGAEPRSWWRRMFGG
jgi:hypothetical protein